MADFHPEISEKLKEFIESQPVFLVATAPKVGRVNLSPKGQDCFRVLAPDKVGYLDLIGSGNETAAHLLDDGRITFMFMSFSRNPKILRLYGQGRAALYGSPEFDEIAHNFDVRHGARQLILADISAVSTSCGYGVPEMELIRERPTMQNWAEKKSTEELEEYKRRRNAVSIDGLTTGLYNEDPE